MLFGSLASLVALLRSSAPPLRLAFSLITWLGVLGLGAQPEVWRLSDNPLQPQFWQSHYWGGVALTGLMLFSLGGQREILRDLRLRRLHVTASVLAALLFLSQGISGPRDLLEIPLSWQKPAIQPVILPSSAVLSPHRLDSALDVDPDLASIDQLALNPLIDRRTSSQLSRHWPEWCSGSA